MKTKMIMGIVLAGLAFAAAGCSKLPQEAVPAVETALSAAETADAATYAPEAFNRARESFAQAQAEVEAQNGKFALTRKYGTAVELLDKAAGEARAAQEAAVAGKEQARIDAVAAADAGSAALEAARTLLAQAPSGKNTKAELDAMQQELTALQSTLEEALAAAAAEDYLDAKVKADVVTAQATAIGADIRSAIEKVNAKR